MRNDLRASAGLWLLVTAAACARPAPEALPEPEPPPAEVEQPEAPTPPIKPNIDPGPMIGPVTIPRDSTPEPSIDSARLDRPDVAIPSDAPMKPSIDSARLGDPLAVPMDRSPPKAEAPVRLSFVGDISLGTTTLPDGVPADSGRGLLAAVVPLLTGDMVVGNFESAVGDTGSPSKCRRDDGTIRQQCYAFVAPTHLLPRLAEAGFTHLNLANNHANDMGSEGRSMAERSLEALGIRTYGPLERLSIDTLYRADSITVVGLIGFATYPHSYNLLDVTASEGLVASVRPLVDVLIVTFHGGSEGADAVHTPDGPEFLGREPRGDLRRWARAVVDAGADAVIGHGPHVLRGIEFYRGRPIAYSLGNFATYRGFNLSGPLGITAILDLELGSDGAFRSARLQPLYQVPRAGPRTDPAGRAIALVRRLSTEDFGATAARIGDGGEILPPPEAK